MALQLTYILICILGELYRDGSILHQLHIYEMPVVLLKELLFDRNFYYILINTIYSNVNK